MHTRASALKKKKIEAKFCKYLMLIKNKVIFRNNK